MLLMVGVVEYLTFSEKIIHTDPRMRGGSGRGRKREKNKEKITNKNIIFSLSFKIFLYTKKFCHRSKSIQP